jgi:hypothetical protein
MDLTWEELMGKQSTLTIPIDLFYESRLSIKDYVEKLTGLKGMTYEEQYLNEDGTERDYPKDMTNDLVAHFKDNLLILEVDSLYCNKFPDREE